MSKLAIVDFICFPKATQMQDSKEPGKNEHFMNFKKFTKVWVKKMAHIPLPLV